MTSRQDQPLLFAPPREPRRPGPNHPHYAIPIEQWQEIVSRIKRGESIRQVAKAYHVSYQTVWRIIHAPHSHEEGGEQ